MKNIASKPADWPANGNEASLENAFNSLQTFIKEPSLSNKEMFLSLVFANDLNETNHIGVFRITKYEIGMLNQLYIYGRAMGCCSLVLFCYEHIIDLVILMKAQTMTFGIDMNSWANSEEIKGLHPVLKVFFIAYFYFRFEKDKSFCDQLCAANNLLYDLSFNLYNSKLTILRFKKEEIIKIYTCLINLWNSYGFKPWERPLLGVLSITLSNLVLKTRNPEFSLLYKCIDDNAASKTFKNRQVWARRIDLLNDKREGKVFPELFVDKKWIKHSWARNIDFQIKIPRYVSSFCRKKPSGDMKKRYGDNVYGYKSDRIGMLIAPYHIIDKMPQFYPVFCYDITYDKETVKEEYNLISDIVDMIKTTSLNKKTILENVMTYWYYSIKDRKKWSKEKERRYEIRYFDHYKFVNCIEENGFLKIESSLFLLPDFVDKNNMMFSQIQRERLNKLHVVSVKDCMFCCDCLQSDYDSIYSKERVCNVCGSKNVILIKSR